MSAAVEGPFKAPVPRVEYELNPEMSSLDMVESVDLTSRADIRRAAFQPKRTAGADRNIKQHRPDKYKNWRREKQVSLSIEFLFSPECPCHVAYTS